MIYFEELLDELPNVVQGINPSKIFVLCDDNTFEHCYPSIAPIIDNHEVIVIDAGEEHKTLETSALVWQTLLENNADRKALLINIGGGVVTDLGGFVAGSYKRGIQFINIPTSYLAMIDASVGGKTGIDFGGIKNSIGLFLEPEAVFINQEFLNTLPKRHFNNGKAEIIKHGLIADNTHFHNFFSMDDEDNKQFIIKQSVEIKKNIIEQDFKESGIRKILNFGHTIGHAIEAYSLANEEDYLLHGEAIAIGMIAETKLSAKYTNIHPIDVENTIKYILLEFSIRNYSLIAIDQMMQYIKNDKKNQNGKILFSLLEEPGKAVYDIEVSEEDIYEVLKETLYATV